eukprot:scaffold25496_cov40-Attheya_sp.AAC.1
MHSAKHATRKKANRVSKSIILIIRTGRSVSFRRRLSRDFHRDFSKCSSISAAAMVLSTKHRVPPKGIPWPSRHGKGYVIISATFLLLSGALIAEASTEGIKNGGGLPAQNYGSINLPDIGSEKESKQNYFASRVQEAAYTREDKVNPGSEPHGVRLTATKSAFGGRRSLKYLDIYEVSLTSCCRF